MNLRQMAEAAGFWGWTVWPEELKEFARLAVKQFSNYEGLTDKVEADTSLTDEPPTTPGAP